MSPPITTLGPRPLVVIPEQTHAIRIDKDKSGNPAVMHIWAGAHAAVTFHNIPDTPITVNSWVDGISCYDPLTWIDPTPSSTERTLYFHGFRMPESSGGQQMNRHICLFVAGSRIIFQVQVWRLMGNRTVDRPYDKSMLRLFGRSMSINQQGNGIVPYQLNNNETGWNRSYDSNKNTEDIIKEVSVVAQKAPLSHLVVNAHGLRDTVNGGRITLGNTGIHPYNTDIWRPLQGAVRFIWFMNCSAAQFWDQSEKVTMVSRIAEITGAYTSAFSDADIQTPRVPNHIEYQFINTMSHCHRLSIAENHSVPSREFFRHGRREKFPNLEDAMAFNLVPREGATVPPYNGPSQTPKPKH